MTSCNRTERIRCAHPLVTEAKPSSLLPNSPPPVFKSQNTTVDQITQERVPASQLQKNLDMTRHITHMMTKRRVIKQVGKLIASHLPTFLHSDTYTLQTDLGDHVPTQTTTNPFTHSDNDMCLASSAIRRATDMRQTPCTGHAHVVTPEGHHCTRPTD